MSSWLYWELTYTPNLAASMLCHRIPSQRVYRSHIYPLPRASACCRVSCFHLLAAGAEKDRFGGRPVSNNMEARPGRALSFLPSWPLSTSACKQLCVVARRALLALTHLDRHQCRQQTDAATATSHRGVEGRIRQGSVLGYHQSEIERGGCRSDYLRLYPCLASWHPCCLPKLSRSRGRKQFGEEHWVKVPELYITIQAYCMMAAFVANP
ncbi:hypothetical protein GQ53DRAFT_25955 [Thozetella sp. PMI_491]|nr:hypothetical protein GQ53DRAFT_25955 [Thozetella sp. PMI_491]